MSGRPRCAGLAGALIVAAVGVGLGVGIGVALAPATAAASTAQLRGFGPRAVALAGAVEADGASADATWDNPALLATLPGLRLGLGAIAALPAYRIEQLRGADALPAIAPQRRLIGQLAVAAPVEGLFGGRLAVGALVHLPVDGATRILSHEPRRPQLPLVEALDDRLLLGLGVGVRVLPTLRVGVQAQLLAALAGRSAFRLSSFEGTIADQTLEVTLESRLTFGVGVQFAPLPALRLAAVWRQQSEVPYALPLVADVEELGRLHYRVSGVGLFAPATLALAAAWEPLPRLTLLASLRYEAWSALPPLGPRVYVSADDAALAAAPARAQTLAAMASEPVPMAAADIVQGRLGVEWRLRPRWQLRAGLGWRPTPLPDATGTAKYLDAAALTLACGAGYGWADDQGVELFGVDVGLAVTHLPRRTALAADPQDPVGGTSVEGQGVTLAVGLRHAL